MENYAQKDLFIERDDTQAPLPKKLKIVVVFLVGFNLIALALVSLGLVNASSLEDRLEELNNQSENLIGSIANQKALDQEFLREKHQAESIISWLDCNYSPSNLLEMIFKPKSKEIRFERLRFTFSEGQPQVQIFSMASGPNEVLLENFASINERMLEKGFRSISVNQPWSTKGLTLDALYILPKKGEA